MRTISITQILTGAGCAIDGHTTISVPNWAFIPDHWNVAFLRGLSKLTESWKGLCVWEIGVGTGTNLIALSDTTSNVTWYFSDYDRRCVPLALRNLKLFGCDCQKLNPLHGSWDLVTPPHGSNLQAPKVNVVFGCLPQVPTRIDLSVGDRRSQYYDPTRYPRAHQNALGLGLNETLLIRARKVLEPGGQVVLNLSGRPGLRRLRALYRETGYAPRLIHRETIPQHAGTSLASLAELEERGHRHFEFYADTECRKPISAGEAEIRRLAGEEVFHNIYVMAGTLA